MENSASLPPSNLPIIVLMGVSGSGKTTVGTVIAAQAGMVFADGDDFHSTVNKQKMAAGTPLTDADREPWLQALNAVLVAWWRAGRGGVLACSALRESYRKALAAGMPAGTVHFVLLEAPRELIAARLAARAHEYMNPRLLDSQLATLEAEEDGYSIANDRAPALVAAEILNHLRLQQAS